MSADFRDRDIISITDFSREEILHLCEAGQAHVRAGEVRRPRQPAPRPEATARLVLHLLRAQHAHAHELQHGHARARRPLRRVLGHGGHLRDEERDRARHGGHDVRQPLRRDRDAPPPRRHRCSGRRTVGQFPVINGGDGKNEHPTQAHARRAHPLRAERAGSSTACRSASAATCRTAARCAPSASRSSHFDDITIRWAAEDFLGMPPDLAALLAARGREGRCASRRCAT